MRSIFVRIFEFWGYPDHWASWQPLGDSKDVMAVSMNILWGFQAIFEWNFAFWDCHDLWRPLWTSLEVREVYRSKHLYKNCLKTRWKFSAASHPRRLDFIEGVSHGRRSRICSIFAFWGCPDLRGCEYWHIGECLSPTPTSGGCQSEGPRELRSLGPTNWHPPSVGVGDRYRPGSLAILQKYWILPKQPQINTVLVLKKTALDGIPRYKRTAVCIWKFEYNFEMGLTSLWKPSNSFSARCTCKTCRASSGERVNGL